MHDDLGGKLVVKKISQKIGDLRGLERRPEHRDVLHGGGLQELVGYHVAVGEYDAGDLELQERGKRRRPLRGAERIEVADLRVPHELDAVVGEQLDVPRQSEPRPVQIPVLDLVVKAALAVELLQLEALVRLLVQKTHRDALFARFARAVIFHRCSCRLPS